MKAKICCHFRCLLPQDITVINVAKLKRQVTFSLSELFLSLVWNWRFSSQLCPLTFFKCYIVLFLILEKMHTIAFFFFFFLSSLHALHAWYLLTSRNLNWWNAQIFIQSQIKEDLLTWSQGWALECVCFLMSVSQLWCWAPVMQDAHIGEAGWRVLGPSLYLSLQLLVYL